MNRIRLLRASAPLFLTALALVTFFAIDRTAGMLIVIAALADAFLSGNHDGRRMLNSPAREADRGRHRS
jgi:hypothetical protein